MEADSQKGVSTLTDDANPVIESADPVAYARIVVPLPAADQPVAGGRPAETSAPEPKQPGVVRRHPFEIYVTGQASAGAWPTVKCAWGTVCEQHTADGAATVAARTDTFTTAADSAFFLKCVFDSSGTITALTLKFSTIASIATDWPEYPDQFSADGLTWYHPIAHIRGYLGGAAPESGEVVIKPDFVIAQLTNTHLRVAQACGMDAAMTRHWKLEPGPGAIV